MADAGEPLALEPGQALYIRPDGTIVPLVPGEGVYLPPGEDGSEVYVAVADTGNLEAQA